MKGVFRMLGLLGLLIAAWLTSDLWSPWLVENLSDDKKSKFVQTLNALLSTAALLVTGLTALLGWRAKRHGMKSTGIVATESSMPYVQDRFYEPTPESPTATSLQQGESPYLGLRAFQRKDADLFFGRYHEIREAIAWLGATISGNHVTGVSSVR